MSGLFGTLNIGMSGLTTQQVALDTTGHNIANANTTGYSRQRALVKANEPLSGMGLNSPTGPGQIGTGSQVTSIQRVRDSFIDYQLRNYTTLQGANTANEKYISEVEGIFNEPTSTGISTLMSKFYSSWTNLATNSADNTARTGVATAASALADQLNSTYKQLQDVKTNIDTSIQADVASTNATLNQIDDLNKQIMAVKFGGSEPNDLMDQRDNLLDALSTKLGIDINNKAFYGEDVNADATGAANTNLISTTSPTTEKRLSYIKSVDQVMTAGTPPVGTNNYTVSYYKNGDASKIATTFTVTLDANTVADPGLQQRELDSIKNNGVLWADKDGNATSLKTGTPNTDEVIAPGATIKYSELELLKPASGEFTGFTQAKKDTDTYIAKLNSFAKILAFSVNAIESGVTNTGADLINDSKNQTIDNMPFFVNSSATTAYNITNNATNLTTVLSAEQDINAGNISVNKYIVNDVNEIKTRASDNEYASAKNNTLEGNGDGSRAQLIASLKNSLMDISNVGSGATEIQTRADLFTAAKGGNTLTGLVFKNNTNGTTLDTYFKDTVGAVASAEQTASMNITNQQTLLDYFDQQKQSVSGVSLDEEMANMVQYQHAYQANAKIISTVDSLLDVVINGLKKS